MNFKKIKKISFLNLGYFLIFGAGVFWSVGVNGGKTSGFIATSLFSLICLYHANKLIKWSRDNE